MTYRNLPVYIGQKNDYQIATEVGETGSALSATNVSVDYPTQTNPKRVLGKAVDANDQFLFGGPSEVGISFSFLIHTSLPHSYEQTYAFMLDHHLGNGTGTNYFPVQVGGINYRKCFLDSYSINARPFEPVVVEVKMTSYDAMRSSPDTRNITGDNTLPDSNLEDLLDSDKLVYGHTASVTNASQAVSDKVLSSISFTKTYARTPVYKLGDINASDFLIDAVDSEMRIESTGLEKLIDHSGAKLTSDLTVTLTDYAGNKINPFGAGGFGGANELKIVMGAGSRVTAANYGIQGGETLLTNATIREVIV